MNKHFTFQDRVKLQYNLDNNYNLSASLLAKALKKSRNSIYYELRTNTTVTKRSEVYNNSTAFICVRLTKFPFTCNGCPNVRCSHRTRFYDAYLANEKANHTLKASRSDTSLKRENIRIINNDVCGLINKGQSVYVAKSTSGCPLSESTIRRYINNDLVKSKRSDLPKSLRFKGKKEYNYPKSHNIDINVLNGRTYQDYKEFIDRNKELKVIQLDSIIGLRTDSKAILTIYFVNSKLQLGIFYDRKHSNVVGIPKKLYRLTQSHGETLYDLTQAEIAFRDERAKRINVVVFHFPYHKTISDFDFSYQPTINRQKILDLASLRFIDDKSNVIFLGSPGAGKTHLATALGMEAAGQRISTYFINFAELMEKFKQAVKENRVEKVVKRYLMYTVLIIDEIGYLPIDRESSYAFCICQLKIDHIRN